MSNVVKATQLGQIGYARNKAFNDVFVSLSDLQQHIRFLESYCKQLEIENECLANRLALKEEPIIVILQSGGHRL